jgi:hypothetical protein
LREVDDAGFTEAEIDMIGTGVRALSRGLEQPATLDEARILEAAFLSFAAVAERTKVRLADVERVAAEWGADGPPSRRSRHTRHLDPACLPYAE